MNIAISQHNMRDLSRKEILELKKLRLKSKDSCFSLVINSNLYLCADFIIFIMKSEGKMIGWSLCVPAVHPSKDQIWVYMKAAFRKRGFGRILFSLAQSYTKFDKELDTYEVDRHSPSATKFFDKVEKSCA